MLFVLKNEIKFSVIFILNSCSKTVLNPALQNARENRQQNDDLDKSLGFVVSSIFLKCKKYKNNYWESLKKMRASILVVDFRSKKYARIGLEN